MFPQNDIVGISDLAKQLIANYSGKYKRIAVGDFFTLDGKLTQMSTFISQELNRELSTSNRFEVVEQELFESAINERKIERTKAISDNDLFKLGAQLYAEAIVFGTISDLGRTIKINARLVATEMGTTLSSAAIELNANAMTDKLLEKEQKKEEPLVKRDTVIQYRDREKIEEKTYEEKTNEEATKQTTSEYFYQEDFSRFTVGDPLPAWGNNVVVLEGKDKRKYISSQMEGKQLVSQNIQFSENFSFQFEYLNGRLDIEVIFIDGKEDEFKIKLKSNWGNERVQLPGSVEKSTGEKPVNTFKLVKNDKTYKVYINGDFLVSGEYANYSKFVKLKMEIPEGKYFTSFLVKEIKKDK